LKLKAFWGYLIMSQAIPPTTQASKITE